MARTIQGSLLHGSRCHYLPWSTMAYTSDFANDPRETNARIKITVCFGALSWRSKGSSSGEHDWDQEM